MSKQKIKLYITPLVSSSKPAIDLTKLSDVLDFVSSKFDIVSIEIQLNEYNKPSEFYFELLSGLCKTITKSIIVDNYTGEKTNDIFKVDSFKYMNLIIDNIKPFTIIYENKRKEIKNQEELISVLSVL